jgi:two-component system, chemotaxis family, protein-glutamate methylesterase/glutaminase
MSHKLMIVDDAVLMRTVIANFLRPFTEFQIVAFAENGKKALEILPSHPDLSLILLDIEMPEMDGLEFLRHAKLKSKAKVIILSSVAVAGSPYTAKARSLGADAIVAKPSGPVSMDLAAKAGDLLLATIRKVIGCPVPA